MIGFFGLDQSQSDQADVSIISLPMDATVSYGTGSSEAPEAVEKASEQIELWDFETKFDLSSLTYHCMQPLFFVAGHSLKNYHQLIFDRVSGIPEKSKLTIGIGGEHSLTVPLVCGAVENEDDLSDVTVVQFDAHLDLRDEYGEFGKYSHACAMRRLVDKGARIINLGVREYSKEEYEFVVRSKKTSMFPFARNAWSTFRSLKGKVYLTIDVDVLDPSLCPNTGTPSPGGMLWDYFIDSLNGLLNNENIDLIGCDVMETVPHPSSKVNEFVAAKIIAKIISYRFSTISRKQEDVS